MNPTHGRDVDGLLEWENESNVSKQTSG